MNLDPLIAVLRETPSPDPNDISLWAKPCKTPAHWMKKSPSVVDPSPQCALNSPDVRMPANSPFHGKDDKNYSYAHVNRVSGRTPTHTQPRQKREGMTQPWSSTFLENSNTSWESEWSAPSGTPPMKTEPLSGGFYKNRVNPGHFQSSDWSPSDSSASSSVPSTYGMMHTPQHSPSSSVSASSTSFYEQNGFYNSGYNYGQSSYMHPSYGQQHQQQYQQSVRIGDNAANSYTSSTRNPSNCPPTSMKQPVPDFQRRQMRNGLDMTPKLIKQEPEEYAEMDGENFTSLFTKSLTSLYSQDTENAYSDDTKTYEPDLICDTPSPAPVAEEPTGFQRYHPPSGGQYSSNMTGGYQDARSNFGFYENRNQNCESMPNMMQDLKQEGNQMNTFRYDRPSFDNMHLYASSPNDTKNQAKKRKMSMPNMSPESGYSDKPKKAPRLTSFKSESKWTPNSFAFGDIQIKQEPLDDYNTTELESPVSNKDASSGSNGNSSSKSPSQYADHPKPPPRKRSPGATCFDRFDKKSTPTNKKVSPLSVYAKVQESIVLSVKMQKI